MFISTFTQHTNFDHLQGTGTILLVTEIVTWIKISVHFNKNQQCTYKSYFNVQERSANRHLPRTDIVWIEKSKGPGSTLEEHRKKSRTIRVCFPKRGRTETTGPMRKSCQFFYMKFMQGSTEQWKRLGCRDRWALEDDTFIFSLSSIHGILLLLNDMCHVVQSISLVILGLEIMTIFKYICICLLLA